MTDALRDSPDLLPELIESQRIASLQRLVPACAGIVAVVSLIVIAIWAYSDAAMQMRYQYLFQMKFNTAATLLLLSLSLFARSRHGNIAGRASALLAIAAIVLCGITLAEYLGSGRLGIDELLFRDYAATRFPGRTSSGTAACLLVIGAVVLCIPFRFGARASRWLLFLAALVPLSALGGYIYHAPDVALGRGVPVVAFQTAACQLLLCLGALFIRADSQLMRLLASESAAGSIARRLLPIAVAVPAALGAFVVTAERSAWFSSILGSAILVSACALFFSAAVWLTTSVLWKEEKFRAGAERRRRTAEKLLVTGEQRLRIAIETARLGSWELDLDTGVLDSSVRCKANFGRAAGDEFSYSALLGSILDSDRPRVLEAVERAIAQGADFTVEYRIRCPDESLRWIVASGRALLDEDGKSARVVGVTLDITERKLAEQQLQQADQHKDEFLATLAHELRNPLAPIRQAAQIARSAKVGPSQLRWSLDVIDRQSAHMALLLDDLLDVSRITQGRFTLRRKDVPLESVIGTAVETARPIIDAKEHRLNIDNSCGPLSVNVDPLRMAQVITNLLTNAAKYTDTGGGIELRILAAGADLILQVRDSGIGISPEMLVRVFEMFSQAQVALERSDGGLGIGLSLVKGLVELHGGTVTAASAGLGQGSEFSVRLPAAIVGTVGHSPPGDAAASVVARKRILIVDDNRDAAESLKMVLEIDRHEVWVTHDGEGALELARTLRPDVLLLDIGLPDMNGYEVARLIRFEPFGKAIRLVAVTGWGQQDDRRRALESGFDYHLTKPVRFEALAEILGRKDSAGRSSRATAPGLV